MAVAADGSPLAPAAEPQRVPATAPSNRHLSTCGLPARSPPAPPDERKTELPSAFGRPHRRGEAKIANLLRAHRLTHRSIYLFDASVFTTGAGNGRSQSARGGGAPRPRLPTLA